MEPYTFREKIGLFLHTSSYFLMPVTWSIKTIFHGGVLGMIWGVSQPAGKWAALQSGGHIKFPNCWIKCWSFLFFFLKIWTRQSPWHHITDVPSHLALTDFSLQFDVALHIRSIRRTAQDVWPFWIPYLKQCVVSLFVWVKKTERRQWLADHKIQIWGQKTSLDRRDDHWVFKITAYTFIPMLKDD